MLHPAVVLVSAEAEAAPDAKAQATYAGPASSNGPASPNGVDVWQVERPADMANIKDLEVMCGKQHMEVQMTFDRPFNGIVFSKVRTHDLSLCYIRNCN